MKILRATCDRLLDGDGFLAPIVVFGDVGMGHVIKKLCEREDFHGLSCGDFIITELDVLHLDPGGMVKMEDIINFSVDGVKFSIRPHKLAWVTDLVKNAYEMVPGYFRFPQGTSSWRYYVHLTDKQREALLCQLMSMEFAPNMKENRDAADAAHQQIFLDGHSARACKGGFNVMRLATDEEIEEIEGLLDEPY